MGRTGHKRVATAERCPLLSGTSSFAGNAVHLFAFRQSVTESEVRRNETRYSYNRYIRMVGVGAPNVSEALLLPLRRDSLYMPHPIT